MPIFTAIATSVGMAISAASTFIGGIGAFCMGESEEAYDPVDRTIPEQPEENAE